MHGLNKEIYTLKNSSAFQTKVQPTLRFFCSWNKSTCSMPSTWCNFLKASWRTLSSASTFINSPLNPASSICPGVIFVLLVSSSVLKDEMKIMLAHGIKFESPWLTHVVNAPSNLDTSFLNLLPGSFSGGDEMGCLSDSMWNATRLRLIAPWLEYWGLAPQCNKKNGPHSDGFQQLFDHKRAADTRKELNKTEYRNILFMFCFDKKSFLMMFFFQKEIIFY